MKTLEPLIHYDIRSDAIQILHPSARMISHQGRSGISFTSIRGRAALPRHALNQTKGSLVLWVLPLQEFFPAAHHQAHGLSNRFFDRFVFLSDREAIQEIEASNFRLLFCTDWHPVLRAEFEQNTPNILWGCATGARAGHFEMRALKWYQLAVTWDHNLGIYVLYANGIKVGHSDVTGTVPIHWDKAAPRLYFGNPAYAMGDVSFFDTPLSEKQVSQLFDQEALVQDEEIQVFLEKTYLGRGLEKFAAPSSLESEGWKLQQSLSLKQQSDYAHFYHQGCGPSIAFTPEGFRVTTPTFEEYVNRKGPRGVFEPFDMTRMYLWTRRMFEGDLYVSIEFKLHARGGLALLMTQAAGMQGEDFLADYPLRSDGSMSVVCWEDVRNYHWEFYREMVDVRNDLVSHACLKNPWFRPLAFQIEPRTWDLDRWYRLTYCQEGCHIRGAIDDTTVIDVADSGFDNNGPVLRHGHIALRCMMRSDITFRSLEVWNRPPFEQTSHCKE